MKNRKPFLRKKNIIILSVIGMLLLTLLIARLTVFSNSNIKKIVVNVIESATGRSVSIEKLRYGVIFPHVDLKNVVIYNSESFDGKENIKFERLKARFSLINLFLAKLVIHEITLDKPDIYLFTDKNGVWNIPDIKEGEKKEKPKTEPFDIKKIDFLKVKVSIEKIAINGLNIYADSAGVNPQTGFLSHIKNFNLNFMLKTKRFSISQALGITAKDIIKNLELKMLMDEENNVTFKNKLTDYSSRFLFDFALIYPTEDKFALDIEIDSGKPKLTYNKTEKEDVSASLSFHTKIHPKTLSTDIENMSIFLLGDKVIGLKGYFNNESENESENKINISDASGMIDLQKINSIRDIFMPALNMNIGGIISIDSVKSDGSSKIITNQAAVSLKNISLVMGEIEIENLNMTNTLSCIFKPDDFMNERISLSSALRISSTALSKDLPKIKDTKLDMRLSSSLNAVSSIANAISDSSIKPDLTVYIDKLSTKFNEADINANGTIRINSPFNISIGIKGLNLAAMTGNMIMGRFSSEINLSGDALNAMETDIASSIANFSYNIDGDISRASLAKLNTKISLGINSQKVNVSDFLFTIGDFFSLNLGADLNGFGLTDGKIVIKKMRVAPYSIEKWLSPNMAAAVRGLPFEEDVYVKNGLSYSLDMKNKIANVTNFSEINITDKLHPLEDILLKANANVRFDDNMMANLNEFELSSKKNNFHIKANGLVSPKIENMNVNYEIKLDKDNIIFPVSINTGGYIFINGKLSEGVAKGLFESKDFFFRLGASETTEILLEDLNALVQYGISLQGEIDNTPFSRYTPLTRKNPNLFFKQFKINLTIPGIIDDAIRIFNFKGVFSIDGANIMIEDAVSSLYIGGERTDRRFFKSIEDGTAPKRGAISIPWFIFNLGNFSPKTFKYDMRILASDVNLKYILPPESRKNIDEEKVLVNFTGDIAGMGVYPLRDMKINTFFLGINKMSLEFSKFIIEFIAPLNPSIKTVDNVIRFGYDPSVIEFSVGNNKLFTTFYFRDQNLDKKRQQKKQLIAFKDDRLRLEPILFSDVITYIESIMN